MKSFILTVLLTLFASACFAEERTYVQCQSPNIIYAKEDFYFINNQDGLIPDWNDLVPDTTTLGLTTTKGRVKDAKVEILKVHQIEDKLISILYSITTTESSLSHDPYARKPRLKYSGWVLCGNFGM